jgi:hypothetical protein
MTLNNGTCTESFSTTDAPQTFVVPDGVTTLSIAAYGAPGGSNANATPGQLGGLGGSESGTVSVHPGETLTLIVGDDGESAIGSGVASGGYGGGGNGSQGGGGGGGGTFVYGPSSALLLAAGGGGGQAAGTDGFDPGNGGDGGGAGGGQNGGNSTAPIADEDGETATGGKGAANGGGPGEGATQCPYNNGNNPPTPTGTGATAGGGPASGPNSPGQGGDADLPSGNSCLGSYAAGGGGGYFGGGGGGAGTYSGGGGGGGSGYAASTVSGAHAGNPVASPGVVISIPTTGGDPQSENLEVTQGTQVQGAWDQPGPDLSIPGVSDPVRSADYTGTTLVSGQKTVVRLYASNALSGTATDVPAELRGYRDDNGSLSELPGGPLQPLGGSRNLPEGPSLPAARTDPSGAYEFVLPTSWTVGDVVLVGDVDPDQSFPGCTGCRANDHFALTGLHFERVQSVVIRPIAIVGPGVDPMSDAQVDALLRSFAYQLPLGSHALTIEPIQGQIDFTQQFRYVQSRMLTLTNNVLEVPHSVEGCGSLKPSLQTSCWTAVGEFITTQLGQLVQSYVAANPAPYTVTVALWDSAQFPGALEFSGVKSAAGSACGIPGNCLWAESIPKVVFHELGHDFGLFHNGCAAGTEVPWPPDYEGLMDGIGLDPRFSSPFSILLPNQWYDPMTYCHGILAHTHISPINWDAIAKRLESFSFPPLVNHIGPIPTTPGGTAPAAEVAAAGHKLLVIASSIQGHTTLSVSSTTGPLTPNPKSSPYAIVLRNRSGHVISTTPVSLQPGHVDGTTAPIPMSVIQAVIAEKGAAILQITQNGRVILQERAKRFHLTARFPRRLKGKGVTIRFHVKGPGAAETMLFLYYSSNGRRYRLIDMGLSGKKVTLPAALLRPRSRLARLRLVADDGFTEAIITSKRL